MKQYSLQFKVADCTIRVNLSDEEMFYKLKKAFLVISDIKRPHYIFTIEKSEQKSPRFEKKGGKLLYFLIPSKSYTSYYILFILRAFISVLLMKKDVYLLHASSFVKNKLAYLFCGPSGSGKSTILNGMPFSCHLGDDTAIVAKRGKNIFCYTSPFDNVKTPNLVYGKYHVGKINIIRKSGVNRAVKLSGKSAFKQLLSNSYFYIFTYPREAYASADARRTEGITDEILQYQQRALPVNILKFLYIKTAGLAHELGVHRLQFTKDCTFIRAL